MPAERPAQTLAFYDCNATRCPASNDLFARQVVKSITNALDFLSGGTLRISAATPPYAIQTQAPDGHIEISLMAPGIEHTMGIMFGAKDDAGRTIRQPFDADGWLSDPFNPWATGLAAYNFDEAWRIIVLLASELKVRRIEIGYGLGI